MIQISEEVTQYAHKKIPPFAGVYAKIRPGGAQMHKNIYYNDLELLVLLTLSVDFISFYKQIP